MKIEDAFAAVIILVILIMVYSLAAMTDSNGLKLACEEYNVERNQ